MALANGLRVARVEGLRRLATVMSLSLKERTEKGLSLQLFLVALDSGFVTRVCKHLEGSN